MAIDLLQPPNSDPKTEWEQWRHWFNLLWHFAKDTVLRPETSADAAATITKNQSYHGVTALTASRTLTLPAASDLEDGHIIYVQDESGAAGTYNVVIQRAGSDTVNGGTSVSITSNYGRAVLIKRGSGAWYSA